MGFSHVSVLAAETLDMLSVDPQGTYVDATCGGGGHSLLIAQKLKGGRLICFDKDPDALAAASERLREHKDKITFVRSDFSFMEDKLNELGIDNIQGALFDLGVSSWQLDEASRGFSYMKDAPLDMRMDTDQPFSAADIVETWSEDEIKSILYKYGEERYAPRIAAAIVRSRAQRPPKTTLELAELVKSAMPAAAKKEKQHPAKRTFQALRIAVNGELDAEDKGLRAAVERLSPGGRIAVITFHSLEDRIAKNIFAQYAKGCICPPEFPVCVCGRKPTLKLLGSVTPTKEELENNPRSRSARLRGAEKLEADDGKR